MSDQIIIGKNEAAPVKQGKLSREAQFLLNRVEEKMFNYVDGEQSQKFYIDANTSMADMLNSLGALVPALIGELGKEGKRVTIGRVAYHYKEDEGIICIGLEDIFLCNIVDEFEGVTEETRAALNLPNPPKDSNNCNTDARLDVIRVIEHVITSYVVNNRFGLESDSRFSHSYTNYGRVVINIRTKEQKQRVINPQPIQRVPTQSVKNPSNTIGEKLRRLFQGRGLLKAIFQH